MTGQSFTCEDCGGRLRVVPERLEVPDGWQLPPGAELRVRVCLHCVDARARHFMRTGMWPRSVR